MKAITDKKLGSTIDVVFWSDNKGATLHCTQLDPKNKPHHLDIVLSNRQLMALRSRLVGAA